MEGETSVESSGGRSEERAVWALCTGCTVGPGCRWQTVTQAWTPRPTVSASPDFLSECQSDNLLFLGRPDHSQFSGSIAESSF